MGIPCFLAAEPWRSNLDTSQSLVSNLSRQLLLLMTDWSTFSIGVREFYTASQDSVALQHKFSQARRSLDLINTIIEDQLKGVKEVKSVRSSFETSLDFEDFHLSVVVVLHASFSLALDQMMASISGERLSGTKWLNRICRSYDYAWNRRPLGAMHMLGPLVVAFPLAETHLQAWILEALNDLTIYRGESLTAAGVTYMAGIMTGQYHPL
jgi:hypothetical protein